MRQLKSLPETSAIPVIFLSGKIHSKEKTQARDLGAADFVEKPFERTEILSRVQTYLKIRRQADNLSFFNTRITQLAKEALGLLGYEQAQELNRLPEFLSINLAKATREALNSLQVMESQWSVVYTFIKPYMTGQTEHSSREALLLLPETLACLRQQIEAIDSVSSQLSAVTGLQSEEGNGSA
jgi:response regulator RpfG family c-di-GMP phosphodiesterase